MDLPDAIVLFAHGARDARWSLPLETLAATVRARAAAAGWPDPPHVPKPKVRLAFLELQAPALAGVVDELAAAGCIRIDVLPVFWARGGHVQQDLPPLLAELSARHPQLLLRQLPVLSELPGLIEFVADAALRGGR